MYFISSFLWIYSNRISNTYIKILLIELKYNINNQEWGWETVRYCRPEITQTMPQTEICLMLWLNNESNYPPNSLKLLNKITAKYSTNYFFKQFAKWWLSHHNNPQYTVCACKYTCTSVWISIILPINLLYHTAPRNTVKHTTSGQTQITIWPSEKLTHRKWWLIILEWIMKKGRPNETIPFHPHEFKQWVWQNDWDLWFIKR